jgi:hypothetical protein
VVWRPCYGPTRKRLSVCLFIGALGVNFRICRDPRVYQPGVVAPVDWCQRVCPGELVCAAQRIGHGSRLTQLATASHWGGDPPIMAAVARSIYGPLPRDTPL